MKNYFLLISVGWLVLSVSPVHAQASRANCPPGTPEGRVCLQNPLGDKTEASQVIGTVIRGVLGILGSLALFMMVWGGFQWLTSAGNKDKIDKGTKTMMWSIIGVIVVLASYILVDEILKAITG